MATEVLPQPAPPHTESVLFLLNGGDDLLHGAGGGGAEQVQQHLVVNAHIGVHIILQPSVFKAVLPLQGHGSHDFALGTVVFRRAGHGVVIERRHRGAPIMNQQFPSGRGKAVQSDDDFFALIRPVFLKIHPGEKGF